MSKKIQKRKIVRRPRKEKVIKKDRVFYALNENFEFFNELKELVLKSSPAEKDKMVRRILTLGKIKLAIVSGVFLTEYPDDLNTFSSKTDLFIVGDDIDRRKLSLFLRSLEAEVGKEIRFGVMEKDEFEYRYNMFDRFVRVLLEAPHEKLINKLDLP
jgi:hypothetical protein